MNEWFFAILSVIIVSLISFIGVTTLSVKKSILKKFVFILVSFSAGALLGGAFFHLLGETILEFGFSLNTSIFILLGIIVFFILEKFIKWHHCHDLECRGHPESFAFMNLIGDAFHNLIDGLIIGVSYVVNMQLGIAMTIAIILHEIPQEIGDFGVLIYSGMEVKKALFYNFLSALTAVLGAVIGLIISTSIEWFSIVLVPFTIGGFIYIACTDLIPELHKENKISKSLLQLFGLILGILLMFLMLFLEV